MQVHPHPLVEGDGVTADDLPDAGEAGQHGQTLALPGRALERFVDRQRTRSDERHVAAQHVPQLRQLVHAGFPQPTADPGRAWIAAHLECRPVLLAVLAELRLHAIGIEPHRAELINAEPASAQSFAFLRIERRSARRKLDGDGNRKQHRCGREQTQARAEDVDRLASKSACGTR